MSFYVGPALDIEVELVIGGLIEDPAFQNTFRLYHSRCMQGRLVLFFRNYLMLQLLKASFPKY